MDVTGTGHIPQIIKFLSQVGLAGIAITSPYTRKFSQNVIRASYRLMRGKKTLQRREFENEMLSKVDDRIKTTYTDDELRALQTYRALLGNIDSTFKDVLGFYISENPKVATLPVDLMVRIARPVRVLYGNIIKPDDELVARSVHLTFTKHVPSVEERKRLYHEVLEGLKKDDPEYIKDAEVEKFYQVLLKTWLKL
jgi:hypothetical protein